MTQDHYGQWDKTLQREATAAIRATWQNDPLAIADAQAAALESGAANDAALESEKVQKKVHRSGHVVN